MRKGEPKIVYVKDAEGASRHVREFAHLQPPDRPTVLCLECGQRLTLKLGPDKVHHAAHRPDSSACILTNPETVLHLNTKVYLHGQLLQANKLLIDQFCTGWDAPRVENRPGGHKECWRKESRQYVWLEGWDAVEQEQRIESRKPDIVFYRGGVPVAAVEVFATHAVDELKKADLARLGVPWLEVKADAEIYDGPGAWEPGRRLPYVRVEPPLPAWQCGTCKGLSEKYVEQTVKEIAVERERYAREAQAILEDKKRRAQERLREEVGKEHLTLIEEGRLHPRFTAFAKIVFVYAYNGKRAKLEYFLTREKLGDGRERIALLFGRLGTVLFTTVGNYTEGVRSAANQAYQQHLDEATKGAFAVAHVTGWDSYLNVNAALAVWRSPYLWNGERGRWEATSQE